MLGRSYVDFALDHPHAYRLMFMTPGQESEGGAEGEESAAPELPDRDAYLFLVRTVSEAMTARRLRPDLTDPHLVAQLYWAALHGAAALSIAKEGDAWMEWRPVEERTGALVDTLIRGLSRGA